VLAQDAFDALRVALRGEGRGVGLDDGVQLFGVVNEQAAVSCDRGRASRRDDQQRLLHIQRAMQLLAKRPMFVPGGSVSMTRTLAPSGCERTASANALASALSAIPGET
jgi:hypothetical protein